ncbi:hypothetical protein [Desulfosporosinus sp. BICA1-9]|uniref:hypothetical protein n=1 Tax=Desulfosporosinus sp. BICA1-9 TaxID=1531958 RepID=UPI00054C80F1|nr:hypothetical protein [Desulfosporosinus sp. BICA1-9]KJS46599.1 MAG: hypothetical protein VR66_24615 [Peptococcaceae bacterium BRH_c23]KJS87352.1 MAG: hypothetical protein JL57_14305 [Desulfosporosinus sp. BICA1-9]HBW37650.1 hypothetical protein [Desulfosporosinus sp.]
MREKNSLKLFISDIEKIISGEITISSEYQHWDEEYKELLFLAQLLAKADYNQKSQDQMETMLKKVIYNIHDVDELDDDELDLVAAGVDLNIIALENKKKD